jgi:hypothetical protein
MKTVDVKFLKAEVRKFDATTQECELHITVDDGKPRILAKKLIINAPEEQAGQLMREVRDRLKSIHKVESDDFLGSVVTVRFSEDEDALMEHLAAFLASCKDKAASMLRQRISRYHIEQKMIGTNTDRHRS